MSPPGEHPKCAASNRRKQDGLGAETLCQFGPRTGRDGSREEEQQQQRPPPPGARSTLRHRTGRASDVTVKNHGGGIEKARSPAAGARRGSQTGPRRYSVVGHNAVLCHSPDGKNARPRPSRQSRRRNPQTVHLTPPPSNHRQHRGDADARQTPRLAPSGANIRCPRPGQRPPPLANPLGIKTRL